jgi:hypothetical protein
MEMMQIDHIDETIVEVELVALDIAIVEADWLCELLTDLPIVDKPLLAIIMDYDNQIVIAKVDNSKGNMKACIHIKR